MRQLVINDPVENGLTEHFPNRRLFMGLSALAFMEFLGCSKEAKPLPGKSVTPKAGVNLMPGKDAEKALTYYKKLLLDIFGKEHKINKTLEKTDIIPVSTQEADKVSGYAYIPNGSKTIYIREDMLKGYPLFTLITLTHEIEHINDPARDKYVELSSKANDIKESLEANPFRFESEMKAHSAESKNALIIAEKTHLLDIPETMKVSWQKNAPIFALSADHARHLYQFKSDITEMNLLLIQVTGKLQTDYLNLPPEEQDSLIKNFVDSQSSWESLASIAASNAFPTPEHTSSALAAVQASFLKLFVNQNFKEILSNDQIVNLENALKEIALSGSEYADFGRLHHAKLEMLDVPTY